MASILRSVVNPSLFATNLAPGKSSSSSQGSKRRRLPSLGLSCGLKRRNIGAATPQVKRVEEELSAAAAASAVEPALAFSAFADGPYVIVASFLAARDLAFTDGTCQLLRHLNAQPHGP